jgi:hypothetical protein
VVKSCTADNRAYIPLETSQGQLTAEANRMRRLSVAFQGDKVNVRNVNIQSTIDVLEEVTKRTDDQELTEDVDALRRSIMAEERVNPADVATILDGIRRNFREEQSQVIFDCMILRGF